MDKLLRTRNVGPGGPSSGTVPRDPVRTERTIEGLCLVKGASDGVKGVCGSLPVVGDETEVSQEPTSVTIYIFRDCNIFETSTKLLTSQVRNLYLPLLYLCVSP